MKRLVALLILGLVILVLAVWWKYPDDKLRVIACDVGQGDGILIQQAFLQVLVDSGPEQRVLECLGKFMPFFDSTIEVVVLTHPQLDHFQGLIPVLQRYRVDTWVANGIGADNSEFKKLRQLVNNEKTTVVIANRGDRITMGDITVDVLWPVLEQGDKYLWAGETSKPTTTQVADMNQISVVARISYHNFSALMTGDIGLAEEEALVRLGVLTDVVYLKVAHHGSKYSSSLDFLRAIQPEVAVVSVGRRNRYGHPAVSAISRLDTSSGRLLRTDTQGHVVVATDGYRWWVEK